jgi:hypothetical protein
LAKLARRFVQALVETSGYVPQNGNAMERTITLDLLAVEEIATATRRTPAAVRAALKRGEIPAVKLGKRWFVRRADFERLFDRAAREVEEAKAAS